MSLRSRSGGNFLMTSAARAWAYGTWASISLVTSARAAIAWSLPSGSGRAAALRGNMDPLLFRPGHRQPPPTGEISRSVDPWVLACDPRFEGSSLCRHGLLDLPIVIGTTHFVSLVDLRTVRAQLLREGTGLRPLSAVH